MVDYLKKKQNIDEYVKRRYFSNLQITKGYDWSRLLLESDFEQEKATINKCAKSFSFILEYTSVQLEHIWFDSLSKKIMIANRIRQKYDDTHIKAELESFFGEAGDKPNINKRDVEDAIDLVAHRNTENSFAKILQSFWESYQVEGRVPITDLSKNYLCQFINAEKSEISQILQRKMGLAMVSRVLGAQVAM